MGFHEMEIKIIVKGSREEVLAAHANLKEFVQDVIGQNVEEYDISWKKIPYGRKDEI